MLVDDGRLALIDADALRDVERNAERGGAHRGDDAAHPLRRALEGVLDRCAVLLSEPEAIEPVRRDRPALLTRARIAEAKLAILREFHTLFLCWLVPGIR